jgi:HD-like signal output (HDOD) protein
MRRNAIELLDGIHDLAPFPLVGLRVIELVRDQRTSASELAEILALDPVLTAKILKVSNSAAWGRQRNITTVRDAVVLLGFEEVRQLALLTCVVANFGNSPRGNDGFDMEGFWLHNVTVAVAAEAVARKTKLANPGDAFTAGILHDIGRLVLRTALPGAFHDALVLQAQQGVAPREAEIRTTGYAHEDVSRALGGYWQFPMNIVEAIGGHHRVDLALADGGLAGILSHCDRFVLGHEFVAANSGEPPSADLEEVERLCGGWEELTEKGQSFVHAVSGKAQAAA